MEVCALLAVPPDLAETLVDGFLVVAGIVCRATVGVLTVKVFVNKR